MTFLCSTSDLHPYECDGPGRCVHCDRAVAGTHDPETCALCRPRSTGDTVALVFNRDFTREQFDALTAVFWAFPDDWADGGKVVFPGGLEVTAKVAKNP